MTHVYFSAEGRISYGHLGRTNSCCFCFWRNKCSLAPSSGVRLSSHLQGGAQDFSLGAGQDRRAENRGWRPRTGWASKSPSPPVGDLGTLWSAEFGAQIRPSKGFPLFSELRMADPDTIIVDYHAAIGGQEPRALPPPFASAPAHSCAEMLFDVVSRHLKCF